MKRPPRRTSSPAGASSSRRARTRMTADLWAGRFEAGHAERLAARRFEALHAELPARSPRAWRFTALRAASRAGALMSEGLRIGHRDGFDSGPFMAHVYANEA